MTLNDKNYYAAKEQLARIAAKIEALYNQEPTLETQKLLRNYYIDLDAVRPEPGHWTEV